MRECNREMLLTVLEAFPCPTCRWSEVSEHEEWVTDRERKKSTIVSSFYVSHLEHSVHIVDDIKHFL